LNYLSVFIELFTVKPNNSKQTQITAKYTNTKKQTANRAPHKQQSKKTNTSHKPRKLSASCVRESEHCTNNLQQIKILSILSNVYSLKQYYSPKTHKKHTLFHKFP